MNWGESSGINNEGDFDQLSLAGVDFGEDYCFDYGIDPTNLEGETMYSGYYDQLGMDYNQMGIVPEGLGADFNQLGIVPSGLGHGAYQQLGGKYQQLGGVPSGLGIVPSGLGGIMDTWNGLSSTHKMVAGGALALAAYVAAKKFTKFKGFGLPVIG